MVLLSHKKTRGTELSQLKDKERRALMSQAEPPQSASPLEGLCFPKWLKAAKHRKLGG